MKLLAVDTSTQVCGVAVVDGEGMLSESLFASRQTHSRHLLSMVEETLQRSGFSLQDMEGLAVTCGPGSFTGLRIGMSVVKALAESCGLKVAGVSTLEALAVGARLWGKPVLAMLDARKGEVYGGLYAPDASGRMVAVIEPSAVSPEALLSQVEGEVLCVGTGSTAYRALIEESLGGRAHFSEEHNLLKPSVVAQLGADAFACGAAVDPAGLVPIYLRKSDAEIDLERRMASKGHG